eukprot:CAMPEP_0114558226 /NCGR_PEP_ID=MMETSP0114-20121206/10259_1 /TAXON_ID=31324 /ORGANISM="Goniomonas sp, Strain m" /LENGTH=197 /DNA_ID=CAMNT_0001743583 /DNA_START=47 /DNA_END=640 /DNA_ORIENTATION=-
MAKSWFTVPGLVLFILNLLLFILGVVMLATAIFAVVEVKSAAEDAEESTDDDVGHLGFIEVLAGLAVMGGFVMLTTLVGFIGITRVNRAFLALNIVMMFLLLLIEIALGIAGFVILKEELEHIQNMLDKQVKKNKDLQDLRDAAAEYAHIAPIIVFVIAAIQILVIILTFVFRKNAGAIDDDVSWEKKLIKLSKYKG